MMEFLVQYLPVLVVVVTAALGIVAYTYQKWVDRRNALVDLRRTAYQDILVSLQKHLHRPSNETLLELSAARARAFIVAPDYVAKRMGTFFVASANNAANPQPDGSEVLLAYAEMTIAMRRDCFERTTLTADEVVKISPVVWGDEKQR